MPANTIAKQKRLVAEKPGKIGSASKKKATTPIMNTISRNQYPILTIFTPLSI
jgi:hypothetical protein